MLTFTILTILGFFGVRYATKKGRIAQTILRNCLLTIAFVAICI